MAHLGYIETLFGDVEDIGLRATLVRFAQAIEESEHDHIASVEALIAAVEATIAGLSLGMTQLTGDVTAGPGSGSQAATIAANAVTLGKMAQVASARVLGRSTAGTGDVEALSTLPTGVQDLITRLGTVVSGDFGNTALKIRDTSGSYTLQLKLNNALGADRTANIEVKDETLTLGLADWTPFTPTWTSSGTAPAIGDGTLEGKYTVIGKIVIFWMRMIVGTTTTFGTGFYSFSLPVTASHPGNVPVGQVNVFNSSTGNFYHGFSTLQSTTSVVPRVYAGGAGGLLALITPTVPFTFAASTTQSINFTGIYMAA